MFTPQQSLSNFPANADESEMLRQLQAGDDQAFEQLVRAYGPALLTVARRFLHQEQDSQDAVQDTFLSAFRALPKFQGNSSLGTWLYRIAVNACLMKLRTRRRKPEISIEDLIAGYNSDGQTESVAALVATLDKSVAEHELQQHVREAIERLPEAYREIVLLRDIEQMSTEDTAHQLEIEEGAVKTRLHRARLALRSLLLPFVQGDGK
jgi:RNA polymerase sigma-70 factor, ECF subfamily